MVPVPRHLGGFRQLALDLSHFSQPLIAPAVMFFAGAAISAVVFERLVARRLVANIIEHLDSLADPAARSRRVRPLRNQDAASVIERLATRLVDVETRDAMPPTLELLPAEPTTLEDLAEDEPVRTLGG